MEPTFHAEQDASEDWDWWHVGRRRVLAAVLREAVARAPCSAGRRAPDRVDRLDGLDILDVGCGTGGTTAFLASACGPPGRTRVIGCDTSLEALRFARRRGLDRLVRADASALPVPDGSQDVVLSLDVLEHHADDAAVAAELHRVLRPGGLLLVTVPAFEILWGPNDVISHHHRRYRLPEVARLIERAGFELRACSYFNTLLFPGVLAVQLVRRALRAGAPPEPASDLPRSMPRAVNALLREVFAAEARWLPRRRLPFGVSALVVGRRTESAA